MSRGGTKGFTGMTSPLRHALACGALAASIALPLSLGAVVPAQGTQPPRPPGPPPNSLAADNAADHRDMMERLGIRALRPGPSGNESAPNAANYDEALANPYPKLPEVLTLKGGRPVTTAAQWWTQRRPEIVEDFEREVYGRVPPDVPKVEWTVSETATGTLGGRAVLGRQVVGRVDNSAHPAITVEIRLTVVTPAGAAGPVPLMIMFRGGSLPVAVGNQRPPPSRFGPPPGNGPPATEQLIAAGWGFAWLDPASIQADNGAGLTRGIIGLVNKGQRRKPDDWGSLRAWAWGAARALDYLESYPAVDATRVGIEGVSRYGKAALVTMAFEPRFAVVLVASSGEGGAKLHRRNFGEAVENLTGSGQYHWMAGNFLKYGASDAVFGSRNAGDIPVDAHQLIALCAPRPTFISYGVPEKGDAKWLDQQGSFMAAVAAGPVFRLLGAKDLGTSDDYMKEKMPPVNVGLLDGQLAWRQHDGGHTSGPNWQHFIPWAARLLGPPPPVAPPRIGPADEPAPRTDANSQQAHRDLLAKVRAGRIDVYFIGDSITRRWGALDYPELLAHWRQTFHGWHAANFAWGGDRTQNMLWRLEHGEFDGVKPKVVVIQAGTNNVGRTPRGDDTVRGVVRGIRAIVEKVREKAPQATIVLTGIFPRNDSPAVLPEIARINQGLAALADGRGVRFLDINDRLAGPDGTLHDGMAPDGLHLGLEGYRVWADALTPILRELLGPPEATDLAPPPTGDPSATRRGR